MISESSIRQHIARAAAGELSLADFEDWLDELDRRSDIELPERRLLAEVRALLWERDDGLRDSDAVLSALRRMAPEPSVSFYVRYFMRPDEPHGYLLPQSLLLDHPGTSCIVSAGTVSYTDYSTVEAPLIMWDAVADAFSLTTAVGIGTALPAMSFHRIASPFVAGLVISVKPKEQQAPVAPQDLRLAV